MHAHAHVCTCTHMNTCIHTCTHAHTHGGMKGMGDRENTNEASFWGLCAQRQLCWESKRGKWRLAIVAITRKNGNKTL